MLAKREKDNNRIGALRETVNHMNAIQLPHTVDTHRYRIGALICVLVNLALCCVLGKNTVLYFTLLYQVNAHGRFLVLCHSYTTV